jgi:hypothetical protein
MTDKERLKLLREALSRLEMTNQGYKQAEANINRNWHWKTAMQVLHALEEDLTPQPAPKRPTGKTPDLGPVYPGGTSVLDASPTHATGGLPRYPAFDTNWLALRVIAPEGGEVTRHSGGGDLGFSVYLTGDSGLKYYFQHMNEAGRAPLGRLKKGGKIGTVGSAKDFPAVRVDHNHVGINAEAILGAGKELKYGETGTGPPYSPGAPTIRKQLEGKW